MLENLGQYKILDRIGSGGLGEEYRARDTRLGRTVAIKVLRDDIAATPERRDRFLRDARIAATLSHPNIATLYEIGEDDGWLYLVCEFVQGQTLKTIIGGRPLNPRRAIDLASQIADALAEAHAAEIVHRNIRVDGIVVTPKGNAKILDFGLAAWMTGAEGAAERMSGQPADPQGDIFSLGLILFEMLTGGAPAPGAGVPSAVNRSLPREIDPIVAKALGKSGGYETAVTLAAELRAIGAMLDVRAEASDALVIDPRPKRSYVPWIVLALALGAAVAVAWYLRLV